ncbi:MAG: two-component system sensor histidine kinase NtrB [Aureliella sp.]
MNVASANLESRLLVALLSILLLLGASGLACIKTRELIDALDASEPAAVEGPLLDERPSQLRQGYQWAIASCLFITALGLLAIGAYLRLLHGCFIAEQHALAVAYQQSELFRTTLSSIGDAVIATDKSGHVTFLNAVAQELTGWKEEDAAGQPLEHVFHIISESTRDRVPHPTARPLAEGRINGLTNHTLLVARDGSERPITDCAAPIRDARGEASGAVLVFHDVSEARRLEEQCRQSQKLEAVGRLAGGIAHDFNNLLTVINGYCQLVEGDPTVSQSSRDFLREIHRAGERAAALTQQLLAFSRSQLLQPTLIDLNEIVSSASSLLKRLIGEDITMHLRLAADLWTIKADRGQIEQILINFAVNARDAMPRGGDIFVEAANVHVTVANSSSYADAAEGRYVMLAFRDTGMGMDESVRMRVFEPYFTTKEYGKGTGLGLATVFGIVKQSDGHISVESQPGAGTTFRVYFPRA